MNSQQLFDAIINGDVSCEHFRCWLHEAVQGGYLQGYEDACADKEMEENLFMRKLT